MSKEEKIIPKSVESLLTEFRELKDRLGGVQDYLASLHEAKDTEGAEEVEKEEERFITFEKTQEVLMITDQIVSQMQGMNYFSDPLFQDELLKTGSRVISIHNRILNHLEK